MYNYDEILGIDVGNSETKSQHTKIVSGYTGPFNSKPTMSAHSLYLRGQYYSLSDDRLYYEKDKTKDERCIVLTLSSIANELLFKFNNKMSQKEEVQQKIYNVHSIALGAGLPIAHYKKMYIDNLINYYESYMRNGIQFEYDGYAFDFKMPVCRIYPQGGAAASVKENIFASKYSSYYVIDIGGYTIDVVLFKNGAPSKAGIPLELGILTLFDNIIANVLANFDVQLDYDAIESVLRGETTILSSDVQSAILDMADKHAWNIINALKQQKIMFDSRPGLFVGGGSVLLKKYITKNPNVNPNALAFVEDSCVNARGYAILLRQELNQIQ